MTFAAADWTRTDANTDIDRTAFNTMTANLWTPEQILLANDAEDIRALSSNERLALAHIFAGLASTEALLTNASISALNEDAARYKAGTRQAVLTAIAFSSSIHSKAYSALLTALDGNLPGKAGEGSNTDTNKNNGSTTLAFNWIEQNASMQGKQQLLNDAYRTDTENEGSSKLDALKRLAATVLAQSLTIEAGFYLPMRFSSRGTLTKTADIVRLINRDLATSSSYLGALYQQGIEQLDSETSETMREYTYDLANNLYFAEEDYGYTLPYADFSLEEDTEKFLSYNTNKALSYLGYPALFPAEISEPNPAVIDELNDMESTSSALASNSLFDANVNFTASTTNAAAGTGATTDSSAASGTAANKTEETSDDDWDF
ncbi:ribonucleoside-diphosphate reductase beta chain [Bifidobacterium commune]|uniref:ribonucleoside-diphosphate reductase n=1 Tax=Bifidobacterium commune TaxID=1505727 RepID=A0A1C4H5H0_9BIFI|nr:ribonucleotide-diphosphate reductase subunit beta [Bifidobacterium commune]MBB2955398.1 ribonucleoside-diphosphate reductase beta chain [Bifidobacterium commune]SCC80157.1 ribonucleoside-diphosphate reductase beta chain [Bifidobacterium commune]